MKQILRTIGSVVAIIAMTAMATSCNREYFDEESLELIPGVERHIMPSASLPQPAGKAHMDGLQNVVWNFGDAININGTNVSINSIKDNGTEAEFADVTLHAYNEGEKDYYWAVYPTNLAGAYSGGLPADFTSTTSLTVHLPETQMVNTANDTLNGYTYMAAHAVVTAGTEYVHFQMRNIGAVLELELTPTCSNNTRVDSIVFTSSNASLAGTFAVSNDATNPTVTPTSGTDRLVVKFNDNDNSYIDITGGKKVCVILPPLASKNLNMRIYGNGRYMEKKVASVTFARSKFYNSAINYDVSTFAAPDVTGFSVAADMRVLFSPGNLQYNAVSTVGNGTHWRFAVNEWDFVGNATEGTVSVAGTNCDNELISSSYSGWIDHFGWGTSGWNNGNAFYMPYSSSNQTSTPYELNVGYGYGPTDGSSYLFSLTGTYAQSDWGVFNDIYNPKTNSTDAAGTWRTLTKEEWVYLMNSRTVYVGCESKPMYGYAEVNGVKGMVILPDNWNPASCAFTYGISNWVNNYTESTNPKWSDMKALGCVFLPAAGARTGTHTYFVGTQGLYWSTTKQEVSSSAHYMYFNLDKVDPYDYDYRYNGRAVRLVKEVY